MFHASARALARRLKHTTLEERKTILATQLDAYCNDLALALARSVTGGEWAFPSDWLRFHPPFILS